MLFRRTKDKPLPPGKVDARLERMTDAELISWADVALGNVGRMLSNYQNHDAGLPALADAWVEAEALLRILDKLITRNAAGG